VSINMNPVKSNTEVICELSDSDSFSHPEDLQERPGFTYTGTEVRDLYSVSNNSSSLNEGKRDLRLPAVFFLFQTCDASTRR